MGLTKMSPLCLTLIYRENVSALSGCSVPHKFGSSLSEHKKSEELSNIFANCFRINSSRKMPDPSIKEVLEEVRALKKKVTELEDVNEIRKLQFIYGYYIDKCKPSFYCVN